ncbi:zinc/iron regulated transporter-related protein 48C isoform X2 [Oratosquilla oratoria]|uniref:zinc/iron regulated transporter-related protein 48C isoform X2 n=1 Tax=Oratosquilla oratoria TaxID=337810 RepID=UPI003F769E12
MKEHIAPTLQALLGTLLTWGLTAAGAAVVFLVKETRRDVLDASLGFAAGVMTAASFWSLLAPAIELAESSGIYGSEGEYTFIPVSIGFLLGALFVYAADEYMTRYGIHVHNISLALEKKTDAKLPFTHPVYINNDKGLQQRLETNVGDEEEGMENHRIFVSQQWRRILLLIVAITMHNIPEGLAVGVGFGAVGKTPLATFNKAKNLAIGIGIQNFPEGMAVSLPLRGAGYSPLWAFWYGQLSGMVEPFAGLLGAATVTLCEPILPYALAFAAGAMIFVVIDDIIPEAHTGMETKTVSRSQGWV